MGRGIGKDLFVRLDEAFEQRLCVTPTSRSDSQRLRRALRAGVVVSPYPCLYVRPEPWQELSRRQREVYAIRSLAILHPAWTFAGLSAAVMHGLEVSYNLMGRVHITTTPEAHSRSCGVLVRHAIRNPTTCLVDGARVLTLERTIFDCLRSLDFRNGLAIADSALRTSGFDHAHFVEAFGGLDEKHRRYRRPFDVMACADPRAENGGESVARAIMFEQGFMIPDLQKVVPDPVNPADEFRADFCWELPQGDVLGELDGREKYQNPQMTGGRSVVDVLADERLRESHMSGSGAKVLRFAYRDVVNVRQFRHLLTSYGIPSGYGVPEVADWRDPINRAGWR